MKKIFNTKSSTPQKAFTQKAFTLLELLVVIAVLGILAVAIITALNPVKKINQTKDSNVKSDMNQIANALQAYIANQNPPAYPPTLVGLVPNEIKTVPQQQTTPPEPYGYGVNSPSVPPVAVWGKMYDATGYWCWDSTYATFKNVASIPVASTWVCPSQ